MAFWSNDHHRGIQRGNGFLGLDHLNAFWYSLRHGEASDDLLSATRTISEVRSRGHCRTDASLQRYAKPTRSLRELVPVQPKVFEYGKVVADNLSEVMHLRFHPHLPPVNQKKSSSRKALRIKRLVMETVFLMH